MNGITYEIGLNATQFLNGMRNVTASAGTAAAAVVSAGQRMAGGFRAVTDVLWKLPDQLTAVQGILSGLSLPSQLAGSAETTATAFRVLIGDARVAGDVMQRIRDLASSTPFEFPDLADAAKKLAAFGESASAIPDVLRRIGDIASGTGTNISELAEIYGKARVQGTLFAEDISQLTGRGIPIIQEFARQLGVADGEIKALAADGQITFPMLETAFKNLTSEGGKFSGMMAEIAGTFEGKMSTLKDSFNNLLAEMGAGINEGLKPVLDSLTETLDGQSGLARQIGESIGYGIEVAFEVIKTGDHWAVLEAGFNAAALSFASELVKAISYAAEMGGEALADSLKSALAGITGFASEMIESAAKEAAGTSGQQSTGDERGIDALNDAAREARNDFLGSMAPQMQEVDARRAEREAEANAAARGSRRSSPAAPRGGAAGSQTGGKTASGSSSSSGGGAKAAAAVPTAPTPSRGDRDYSAPGERAWWDDAGKAADAAEARKLREQAEADFQRLYGSTAAPAAAATQAAGAADASPMPGGGAAPDPQGGRSGRAGRIQGAILPGSFNYVDGVKVPAAGSLDRATGRGAERQERQREQAGGERRMEQGDQREQRRDLTFNKLLKEVEEIGRRVRGMESKTTQAA